MLHLALVALLAPSGPQDAALAPAPSLVETRADFTTRLVARRRVAQPPPTPPEELYSLVSYPAPLGENFAYLGPVRAGAAPRPAVVWLTGGWPAARGGDVWSPAPPENDQSASALREAGVVLLFPTVRGTAGNPGVQEAMFGEVDDVVAAAEFLRGVEGVDPERVYLAGHSTGATLALLVAEATDRFRGVFAFGPAGELEAYGGRDWPFDVDDPREFLLRSPVHHLDAIASPTWIFEGRGGNVEDLEVLADANGNPRVRTLELVRDDHFTLLTPITRLLGPELLAHREGPFSLDLARVEAACADFWDARREQRDLARVAELRLAGRRYGDPVSLRASLLGWSEAPLEAAREALVARGFRAGAPEEALDDDGDTCLRVVVTRDLPFELEALLTASRAIAEVASDEGLVDEGWDVEAPVR